MKSRLFKWLLRGPVTASLALTMMTLVRRAGVLFDGQESYSAFVPLTVVVTVLLFEHLITLFSPLWERCCSLDVTGPNSSLLQNIEERLLTRSDLQQFLETVLAAVRDHLQSPCAFVAALDGNELTLSVVAGNRSMLEKENLDEALQAVNHNGGNVNSMNLSGVISGVAAASKRRPTAIVMRSRPCWVCWGSPAKPTRPMDGDQRDAVWLLARSCRTGFGRPSVAATRLPFVGRFAAANRHAPADACGWAL